MWQLPPMWPSAVTSRCHLFPIHHNIAQTNRLHLPLTEFISHLRTFKCLKSLSWRLSKLSVSLLLDALQRATCQEFAGVSTELLPAVRSLTLVEACTVFLSYSQHTQPPSLFTNFSQDHCESWLLEQTLLPRETCYTEPSQTKFSQQNTTRRLVFSQS